jgi:hypothetical protein
MSLTLFKPNSKNTGSLFSFKFRPSSKGEKVELSLYIQAVQQATWNAATKKGAFGPNAKNPNKTISIKLTEFEVGGILNAIKSNTEFKGFHTFPGGSGSTQFWFTPAVRNDVIVGFFFNITGGTKKFSIPISLGECETLANYLDFGLKKLFTNRFRAEENFRAAPQELQSSPVTDSEPEPQSDEAEENPFEPGAAQVEEQTEPLENPFG